MLMIEPTETTAPTPPENLLDFAEEEQLDLEGRRPPSRNSSIGTAL